MDERKAAILRAVVETYVETAQPIGSGHIARHPDVAVSPATVRNEMVALEHEGFLYQPHTSAGRVPTDKGYRFYVDSLTPAGSLGSIERQRVSRFFADAHGAIERMLHDTSRLLAGLTDYAAVVVGPGSESASLRSVQLVGLAPRHVLVVAVLSNGVVERSTLELADEALDEQLALATAHLSAHLVGSPLADLVEPPSSGDTVTDGLATAAWRALAALPRAEPDTVFVGGTARVAESFDAVDTVRGVLVILEQQYVVVGLLRDVLDRGLNVSIGTEHGVEPLAECSVVVAPYEVDGESVGAIGVLGPTRMHYQQAMAAVALVGRQLSRALTEG